MQYDSNERHKGIDKAEYVFKGPCHTMGAPGGSLLVSMRANGPAVEAVCADLHQPYLKVVAQVLLRRRASSTNLMLLLHFILKQESGETILPKDSL